MNITTKLSYQFTFIVTGILLFFSLLVYYFSYTSQLNKFRDNLLNRAKNTAVLLINVAEVDSALLKKIHQSTISWIDEEIVLTDSTQGMIYNHNIQYLSEYQIRINTGIDDVHYFSLADKDGVCYKHRFNKKTYNVYVLAFDKSRKENLSELRNVLFWSILFSLWLSVFLSYLYSKRAIKPISKIVQNVKEINSLKLNSRLDEGRRKDEIEQLAVTFNEMITNLEIAFKNQADFVLNASHELRTPVTIMISESDYLLSKDQAKETYIHHIKKMVDDLKDVNTLINSLLELAYVNKDICVPFVTVRIDEIIFSAIHQVKIKNQGRNIIPLIQYPEDGNDFLITGNPGLLEIAMRNLLDNACKFSDDDVIIELIITDQVIDITISDKGIGIPKNELADIFNTFKRASNAKFIGGFGVGLSLVAKIMDLHSAKLNISSTENKGTQVHVQFIRTVF